MKRLLVSILLLLCFLEAQATEINIIHIRNLYYKAIEKEEYVEGFRTYMNGISHTSELVQGYKAMVDFVYCKTVINPYTKLSYFKKGKEKLEITIARNQNHIELRYLRFLIQTNVPKILGYDKHIEEDKNFLLSYLLDDANKEKDLDLYSRIRKYMLQVSCCTQEERKKILNQKK